MALLARLLPLLPVLWALCSGLAGEPCRGFKHLENGRTFFRYKGLYATFTCNPGFRLHGHPTSSCVSGQWVRDPPVCVGSGCPSPGGLEHGRGVVSEDRSFVAYSCERGYRLYGSSLAFCKGKVWSSPTPQCKESDITSSYRSKSALFFGPDVKKDIQALPSLQEHVKPHHTLPSKEAYLHPGRLLASLPGAQRAGGLLLKPKLSQARRKPLKTVLLQRTRTHGQASPVDHGSLNPAKPLGPLQQMAAFPITSGSVLTSSTIKPPLLIRADSSLTQDKLNGDLSRQLLISAPTRAALEVGKNGDKEQMAWPSLVKRDRYDAGGLGNVFFSTPASQPEVPYLPPTKTHSTSTPLHLNGVSSTVSEVNVGALPDSALAAIPHEQQRVTVGEKQVTNSLQLDRLLLSEPSTSDPGNTHGVRRASLHSATQPPGSPAAEAPVDWSSGRGIKEQRDPADDNERSLHEEGVNTQVVKAFTEEPAASPLPPTTRAMRPPIPPASPGTVYATSTHPHKGLEPRGAAPVLGSRWDLQPGVGTLTRAAHLESSHWVTNATDAKQRSPPGLAHRQAHTQHWAPQTIEVQIAQTTEAEKAEESRWYDLRRTLGYDLRHGHERPPHSLTPATSLGSPQLERKPSSKSHSNRISATDAQLLPKIKADPSFTQSPFLHESDTSTGVPLPTTKQRPVCPYPPLPSHGTFYFRTFEKPAARQYRHYIQYACYPGYTLAQGDVYSHCQENGTWSGSTPVCLEVTPCAMNNGGCSQICSGGRLGLAQCECREGFMLLEDQHTCKDIDECVEELHYCQQACVNTLGSFRCSCRPGFKLSADGKTCTDTSACVEPGRPACEWKCVNVSGLHHCVCPRGFQLHADGRHCADIDECNYRNGGCSHTCRNVRGGYKCTCPDTHVLSLTNRRKCVSHPR